MKYSELGRSLTEMLGVLAVIGVLSVSGLYGYSVAMHKHRTNELMRELNFRANQVATQLLLGKTPDQVNDLENAFLASGEYSFSAFDAGSEKFYIVVKGTITEPVCRQLYTQLSNHSFIRGMGHSNLDGNDYTKYTSPDNCAGQEQKNSLTFVFRNDMDLN